MTQQKITVNQKIVIAYNDEFSLLDCLEENQIPANYNCRGGYCGLCKVILNKGKVIWVQDSLVALTDKEILTCCCVPDGTIDVALP